MLTRGLGEKSAFAGFHPIVNGTFFVLAIGITMFSMSPWFLAITFIMAWIYSVVLRGQAAVKMNCIFIFWTVVIMAIVNVFFTHDGETVLLYIHGNAITMEALIYGVSAAVMLSAVLIWFTCFNVIITAEKLIYIFGRTAPVFGLTLSMIFRYIPLLRQRYREIHMGQQCLGESELNDRGRLPFGKRLRRAGKNVSILISWSLESSIESADSMEARGYGLKGRTSFHLYRFDRRDALLEIWLCLLGAISVIGCVLNKTDVYFYPAYRVETPDGMTVVTMAAFLLLMITPAFIDLLGELRWKRSDLTI